MIAWCVSTSLSVGGRWIDEANTIVGAGRADLVLLDLPETQVERPLKASAQLLGELRA